MGKTFLIDEALANKILSYLGDKPFVEVYEIAHGLLNLKEYKEAQAVVQYPSARPVGETK